LHTEVHSTDFRVNAEAVTFAWPAGSHASLRN